MIVGAIEDSKPRLKPKPNEKNIAATATTVFEEMMAGAIEDSKLGLEPKPNEVNIAATAAY